jgi:signal transduction histidine kinase
MTQQSKPPAQRLAELIDEHRLEIERRWLRIVETQIAKTPGIALTNLRDGLPDYLKELVKLLSSEGGPDLESGAEPAWARVASEHGITRVRIGFDIKQLIQEFIVLRRVIHDVASERGLGVDCPDALLADSLDGAITAAVTAYVGARDYLARRKQAENIGFLTHELRGPLTAAIMAAARLRHGATPEQLRLLEPVERNQRRIADLIDSSLLTGRLEAGKVEARPVEVRLGEVIEPALEAARSAVREKGVAFEATYDPEQRVHLDPSLTRSALQNLADNAAKYTDHGRATLTVEDAPDEVVIHLRDTCEGISEAELRTIFEPFERGTTGKSGTGLGLAIARRAVEAQGGSIGAESPGASGCHFWIRLPKRQR